MHLPHCLRDSYTSVTGSQVFCHFVRPPAFGIGFSRVFVSAGQVLLAGVALCLVLGVRLGRGSPGFAQIARKICVASGRSKILRQPSARIPNFAHGLPVLASRAVLTCVRHK